MFSVPASGKAAQLTYTYTSYVCVIYIYMHVIYLYIYVIYIHMYIPHTCFERGSSIDLYIYVICMCNIYIHACHISMHIRDMYIYICTFFIPALGEAAHSTYTDTSHMCVIYIYMHVIYRYVYVICIYAYLLWARQLTRLMHMHNIYTYMCTYVF